MDLVIRPGENGMALHAPWARGCWYCFRSQTRTLGTPYVVILPGTGSVYAHLSCHRRGSGLPRHRRNQR